MPFQQFQITCPLDVCQCTDILLCGVAVGLLIVLEVRGDSDIQRGRRGIHHIDEAVAVDNVTIGCHLNATLGMQAGRDTFLFYIINNSSQLVIQHRALRLQRAVEVHVKP